MIVIILKCHVKGFQNDFVYLLIHSKSIVSIFFIVIKENIVKSCYNVLNLLSENSIEFSIYK